MGNKHAKIPGAKTNYRIEIEYFGDRVVAGSTINGQAVFILDDQYVGKAGLDKAHVSLIGTECVRHCG